MRRAAARSLQRDHTSSPAMDPSKHPLRSPVRFSLLSRIASAPPDPKSPRGSLWISIAALATVSCIFVGLRSPGGRRFGIVIDGGSTGTRIHVFAYFPGRGAVPMIDQASTETLRVVPGLSSFDERPENAGESLHELLEFARKLVPRELWWETEVRLMATAGLRLLEVALQDRILESCRKVLRNSHFLFQDDWAEVITGSDEGIYAWVTANYVLGNLGNEHSQTTGIIELGGASAQITFVSSESLPPHYSYVLKFGKATYNLYTHSFLHFGQNIAYEAAHLLLISGVQKSYGESGQENAILDPCSPKGLGDAFQLDRISSDVTAIDVHAAGNFSQCRTVALMLLQKEKDECSYKHCSIGSVYVPKLQGQFLATENFFYTSKFLGLSPGASISDVVNAGEEYCGTDWPKLKERYPGVREENLLQYCFSSAYIVALLHDSLGIDMDDRRIKFANRVGNIPLDWAMGAFLMKVTSTDAGAQSDSDWTINLGNSDAMSLLAILGIFSILATAVALSTSKWRKPQLKTIYDLERGRYIITRLSP